MVDRNLIRNLENDQDLSAEIELALSGAESTGLSTMEAEQDIDVNALESGRRSLKISVIDSQHHCAAGFRIENPGQSVFHSPIQ